MIWQQPWAWVGSVLLVLPILVHLLSRAPADTARFPTLRFIDPSRLTPRRRTRLRDIPLLLIRLAALAAAVAALAQPLWRTDRRVGASSGVRPRARVVLLDTSASVFARNTAASISGVRRRARILADSVPSALVVETATPARALIAAAAWLQSRPSPHEIVVISDFQRGGMDARALAVVPAAYGVRLLREGGATTVAETTQQTLAQYPGVLARVGTTRAGASRAGASMTDITWIADPTTAPPAMVDDSALITSAQVRLAAESQTVRTPRAMIYAGRAATLAISARRTSPHPVAPLRSAALILAVARDDLLREVARTAPPFDVGTTAITGTNARLPYTDAADDSTRGVIVARNMQGAPVVMAFTDTVVAFVTSDAASSATARALMLAAARAAMPRVDAAEFEPELMSDEELRAMSRSATDTAAPGNDDVQSDAPWLWAMSLVLLGLEWSVRRRQTASV